MKCYGHWLKAPNRMNAMNFGERWLRSVSPGEDDKEKGRSEDVVVTMVIDPVLATNQGVSIRRNIDGNENVRIMVACKEGDIFLPTRTPPTVKGKQVKGTTNVIDFNEDSGDEMDEGLIVNDAKRRRSLVGSPGLMVSILPFTIVFGFLLVRI